MNHANHQGEPGDTGTGGSTPCIPDCSAADHLDYLSEVIVQCVKNDGVRADALGAIEAVRTKDASAPTPPDRVGEEIGRLANLAEIPPGGSEERERWLEQAKRQVFAVHKGFLCTTANGFLALMSEARKQGQRDVLASAPSPDPAGAGEISDDAIQAALKAYHETHDTANVDDEPEDLDHAAMEAALYEADKVRGIVGGGSDGGARIFAGLEDAVAFARGDTSRATLLVMKYGELVEVDSDETPEATPQQPPSPTTETDPCHWGGGNDIIWCSTCGAEYAYAKGEERPACPRLQAAGEVRHG